MRLTRQTSRYGGLPDLYSFNCLACDEWHVEEGNAAPNQKQRAKDWTKLARRKELEIRASARAAV